MTLPLDGGGAQVDTRNVDVNLNANTDAYVTGMDAAYASTNRTANAVDVLDQKVRNAGRTIQSGLLKFSRDDFIGLGVASADAATFDKQLGTLNATAAVTNRNFAGVKGAIENTFTSLPESRTSVVALAETINQLGVTGPRAIGQLLMTFSKLGEATGEGPQQLAQGLIQLSRLMGQTDATKITGFANGLLTVSKDAGVSATGVLGFAQAIAPLARQAGIGEAAVLGISAAFSKAGADGYQAANTFNSIIGDITNLVQTGSPEIAKYASFIGMTVEEFRKLPRKEQILDIFQAIGKGGPQAIGFVNQLGLGTRAISAVQAVAQSGGLRSAISTAERNSTGSRNLDKGAEAASDNLADGLSRVRNELTQIGTEIGETFQGPLKIGTNLLGGLLHLLNEILKPLSPIIAGFGALAGAVAGVAGAAGGLGGLVLAGGAANLLLRSGPSRAFREGMRDSRGVVGETEEQRAARLAQSQSGVRYAAGALPARAARAYEAGQAIGAVRAPVDPAAEAARAAQGPGVVRQAVRYAVRAPGQVIASSARSSARLYRDMGVADYNRSAYRDAAKTAGAADQEVAARRGVVASLREWARGQAAANKASLETEGTVRAFGRSMSVAAKETTEYGIQIARTGASLALTGGRGFTSVPKLRGAVAMGAAEGEAGALGAAGAGRLAGIRGALSSAGSILGRVAFNPATLLAAMFGPMLFDGIKGLIGRQTKVDDNEGQYLNPVKKMNDELGIATSKLASFGSALDRASPKSTSSPTNQKSADDALTISPAEVAKYAQKGGVTDKTLATLTGNYGYDEVTGGMTGTGGSYTRTTRHVDQSIRDPRTATALLQSYNLTDPRQLAAAGDNLLRLGYSKTDTESILRSVSRGGTPDYGALGQAATRTDVAAGRQAITNYQSPENSSRASQRLIDSALTRINTDNAGDLNVHSARYASARELQGVVSLLSPEFAGATGARGSASTNTQVAAIARALATVTGGKAADFYSEQGGVYSLKTGRSGTQGVVDLLSKTDAGKQLLSNAGIRPGSQVTSSALGSIVANSANEASTSAPKAVSGGGNGLGAVVGRIGSFQRAAFGTQQGDPATIQKAVEDTADAALGMTGSYTSAATNLQKLADATGGAAGTVLSAAADWARTLQQFQTQTQSRSGQLQTNAANLVADRRAALPNAQGVVSQAAVDRYKNDRTQFAQQEESYRQYLISVEQQAKQYHVQQQRSEDDYQKSIYRSERDFQISRLQGQQDFNRQMERNQRDHNRQLKQQNAVQAQSVYDPYGRVQAKFTVDANTLDQNLGDENQRLSRQKRALDQLHKMGLSTEAIQTLNLASPDLSQQVDALLADAAADPKVIGRLNADTARRVKLTRRLTQNDFNLTFKQGEDNYKQSIKDADKDYDLQRRRAQEAQSRSLHDMATDFNLMVDRSAQDLTTSMTEIYGSYASVYTKTLKAINRDIGKYVPNLAKTLAGQVAQANRAINAAADPTSKDRYARQAAIGRRQIGTIGMNDKGQLGSYDARGHWTPYTGYVSPGEAAGLTRVYSPTTGHQTGAISTKPHVANISEGGRAEMILPLDPRGQQFMAGMYQGITRHLVQTLRAGAYASVPSGQGGSGPQYVSMDQSTNYTGDIHIEAANLDDFEKKMAAKRRLSRLNKPRGAAVL